MNWQPDATNKLKIREKASSVRFNQILLPDVWYAVGHPWIWYETAGRTDQQVLRSLAIKDSISNYSRTIPLHAALRNFLQNDRPSSIRFMYQI